MYGVKDLRKAATREVISLATSNCILEHWISRRAYVGLFRGFQIHGFGMGHWYRPGKGDDGDHCTEGDMFLGLWLHCNGLCADAFSLGPLNWRMPNMSLAFYMRIGELMVSSKMYNIVGFDLSVALCFTSNIICPKDFWEYPSLLHRQ